MTIIFGVIAEDDSDVDVVKELIRKVIPQTRHSVKHFVGHGCGPIRAKCCQWSEVLKQRGCSRLILLHDLDQSDLTTLQNQLQERLSGSPIRQRIILIPIREIEAWLLSDSNAIRTAMNLRKPVPHIPNPQAIVDPKRRLSEIIFTLSDKNKRYINATHNRQIAAELDLANVRRCSSFIPLEQFLLETIP